MFRESQQIGRYTLIRKLGEGGFGEVWLAENRTQSPLEKVAIKLPRKEQIDFSAVKEEIFNWTISGKHKNILPIIECEVFNNQIAIVSEYAPDGSLQDLIDKKGSLPVAEAVEIIIGILDGLAHLHNRKIIHRDLKPDNVLFQGNIPRLTDFGISRAIPIDSQSQTISGTLSYMAPEAFDGKRNAQTDIWAVGVILYQLLTGNLPFPQKEMMPLVRALAMQEPAPLPASIPPDLQSIIQKALAKELPARYQTADEMRDDLENFRVANSILFPPLPTQPSIPIDENEKPYEEPIFVIPPSPPNPKPNRLYFAIPAGILLLFAIFGGYWLFSEKSINSKKTSANVSSSPSSMTNIKLIPFRKGDKWGFSDENKKIIIDAIYDDVQPFSDGLAKVTSGGSYGFIDKTGQVKIQIKYGRKTDGMGIGEIGKFNNGAAFVNSNDDKYVLINRKGEEISKRYDSVGNFNEGLAKIESNKKWGFINEKGEVVISLKYDGLGDFNDGIAAAFLEIDGEEKIGFIDKSENKVIPFIYKGNGEFNNGLLRISRGNKVVFIDKKGDEFLSVGLDYYDVVSSFSEGLAPVKLKGLYGFIDKSGKEVILTKYEDVNSFKEGMAVIKQNGKYGFINRNGEEVIKPVYEEAESFSEGLAAVKFNGMVGFIDKTGQRVIDFRYIFGGFHYGLVSFKQGLAKVERNGNSKIFYIDKNGTEYYEP